MLKLILQKKLTLPATVDSDGVIVIEPFSFSNNHEGFKLLKSKLDSLDKSNLLIGLESISTMQKNVIFFSAAADMSLLSSIQFRLPLCVKQAFARLKPTRWILCLSAKH